MKARLALLAVVVLSLGTLFPAPAQGAAIRWGVTCGPFTHARSDDPIVFPNQPNASHLHTFVGNRATNAFSTADSLRGGESACQTEGDTAAYWVPALYVDGSPTPVQAQNVIAYYLGDPALFAETVAFPGDAGIVAGEAHAPTFQDVKKVAWGCGKNQKIADPNTLNCPGADQLGLFAHVFFPQCWDGVTTTEANWSSHFDYPEDVQTGPCPAGFPVRVPKLHIQIRYGIAGQHTYTLSSGERWTFHADFLNAWDQGRLAQLTTDCIVAGIDCGLDPA